MSRRTLTILSLFSLLLAVGTGIIAYLANERYNATQDSFNVARATIEALGTEVIVVFDAGDATLTAVGQNAADQIDEVRAAASTLQAGSLGTRTGLEARIADMEAGGTAAAGTAAAQAAEVASLSTVQADLATNANATQAGLATEGADQAAALDTALATRDALQSAATANAALVATQEAALDGLTTQVAQAQASAPTDAVQPTALATTEVAATATPAAVASAGDARIPRDRFLETFPQPFTVDDSEWIIADDPQFQLDTPEEASVALLLVNEAREGIIINVFFGGEPARYAELAEGGVAALGLTVFDAPTADFPTPSVFGSREGAYEAIWADERTFVRLTFITEDGAAESRLVSLARAVLQLLSGV